MIKEFTEKELSSSGGNAYQVLVENQPYIYQGEKIFVKIVVINNKSFVKFGYYKKEDRGVIFVEIEELDKKLKSLMENPIIAGIDFTPVAHLFNSVNVEVNSVLRLINYNRPLFSTLSEEIYKKGVSGSLSAGSMELTINDISKLYDYFETRFVSSYVQLMQAKILPYLKSKSNNVLRTYLSFKTFIPVLYKGKCIVNPFLESYKMNRIFIETDLFKKAKESTFSITTEEVVYLMTNKEICESLKLNKYLKFYGIQFILFLLGLFNPDKYPSTKGRVYIDDEGNKILNGDVYNARQVSSLYSLCYDYRRFICPPSRIDEYVSILATATL